MTWEIQITGDRSDLEELSKVLSEKDLSILQENEHFILKSEEVDALSDHSEVKKKAIELLKSVNACAKLALDSRKDIEYKSISWLNENGTRNIWRETQMCVPTVSSKISGEVIRYDGTIEIYNQATPAVNWIKIAQRDDSVKKVFNQINHDFNSWVAFFKVIEILQEDNFASIMRNGMYRAKADRLTETANSYKAILEEARHAKKSFPLSKNPMEFSEAKSFIKMILHEWLKQKE